MSSSSNYIVNIFSICRRKKRDKSKTRLKYNNLERKLNRLKNKKHPPIPRTLERTRDVFSVKKNRFKYGNNLDESKKLYIATIIDPTNPKCAFMIFASFNVIQIIEKYIERGQRRYLLDGTFKVTPKLFYQLLIISIEYKNDVMEFYT